MKRLLVACLLAVLAAPAFAIIGTSDDVPAATLLLPYFEVDLDNPNGVTTLMSINNASASAVVAHVVVWTDLSVHVLDFDVYLTGYDVQTINLRDILIGGILPVTADVTNDPSGAALGVGISPRGPASEDIAYPILAGSPNDCSDILPYPVPALSPQFVEDYLQPMLTGEASTYPNLFFGLCGGISHDADRIARGYITVDAVNNCNLDFPDSQGYFVDGGQGLAINANVLWGDYFYVNTGENFAQGETLVHIEADSTLVTDGAYSFYGRYSYASGCPACDNREGLGNVFAARYVNGAGFDGGTSYLVWRDAKTTIVPFDCADLYPPETFPLGVTQVVIFDEEEQFEVPDTGSCTISPCPGPGPNPDSPFPWETQRVKVGEGSLVSSYDFGWMYLNLNIGVATTQLPEYVDLGYVMQNWVSVVMDAQGRFSVGYDAVQLGNVTNPATAPDECIYIGGPGPCLE